MNASANVSGVSSPASLQAAYLALLPRIQTHAAIYFRHVRCPHQKEEQIAETVALAWKWFLRLHERGKDVNAILSGFISLAARAVKSGRRLCGVERSKDVLSPLAQQRYQFAVEFLPASMRHGFEDLYSAVKGQQQADAYEERLCDNTVTPPPDAAAFRIDWPLFLSTLSERDRALAHFLSLGHEAKDTAQRFQLSPGRVTQLRQRWCKEWRACQGEDDRAGEEANGHQAEMASAR